MAIGAFCGLALLIWRMKKFIFGFALWLAGGLGARAQEAVVPLQQNPPEVRWQQINTPQFRVIFPVGYQAQAQRTARSLQMALQPPKMGFMPPVAQSLGKLPRRISVLLQNRTTISNGFVTLTPRRSEFFTMPPQDYNFLGTNHWLDLLTIHEMRHVVQLDKSRTGLTRAAYWLFGNNMQAALGFLAIPNWFWEGDAVGIETALTPSGRGRIPHFDVLYRSTLLERGGFGYHKAMLGSFRDQVPNHYVLGYLLTTHLKRRYGNQIFDPVARRAWGRSLVPFTFTSALKKHTGRYVRRAYADMNQELDSLWQAQLAGLPLTEAARLNQRPAKMAPGFWGQRPFTSYEFPQPLPGGGVVVLRTGLAQVPQWVRLDSTGRETVLHTPGPLPETAMLSAAAGRLVWVEYAFDPRWQMRNYQVIKILEIETRQVRTLTRRSRYVAAALSPDGRTVATIEATEADRYALVLLDAETGAVRQTLPNPDNDFLAMPRFAPDGQHLAVLRMRPGAGKTIAWVHLATGQSRDLLPFGHENLGHPVPYGRYVFYNSPYNGIDQIYALDTATQQRWQVVARRYGAYNPAPSLDGSTLYFNDFTVQGHDVCATPLRPEQWLPLAQVPDRQVHYYAPLAAAEGQPNLLAQLPDTTYAVRPYRKSAGLLNIYSWSPFANPSSPTNLQLAVYSQNLIGTASTTLGLDVDAAERTGSLFGTVSYQAFYPIIDVSVRASNRSANELVTNNNQTRTNRYTWRETVASVGLRIPWVLTNSRFSRSASVATGFSLRQVGDYQDNVQRFSSGNLYSLGYSAGYSLAYRRAPRDLVGRWAWSGALRLVHTPFGGDFEGQIFSAETRTWVPGLLRHHALGFRGAFQREAAVNYRFNNGIQFPRGYLYTPHFQLYTASVDYLAPLCYPDLVIGPLVNVQRLKTRLFADFGQGYSPGNPVRLYQALGVDLTFDLKLFRLPDLTFDLGVRYLHFPLTGGSQFELVLGQIGF